MDADRRKAKEDWVTGHSGGPMMEIALISALSVAGHLLLQTLNSSESRLNRTNVSLGQLSWDLVIEYAVLVVPSLVAISFPEWTWTLVVGLSLSALVLLFQREKGSSSTTHPFSGTRTLPPILAYRATMMLLTCASILAVDFKTFPRRFAKCEDYGTSLMDMGVGSFVFSNGLVSGRSKLESKKGQSTLGSALPIFALGIARAISVRGANYQTHSSEYGLHWNFFVTLGVVAIGAGWGRNLERLLMKGGRFPLGVWTALGIGIAAVHQLALSSYLESWVSTAPRTNLLSANKEGIVSSAGYLAIYFCALDVGRFALGGPAKDGREWTKLTQKLVLRGLGMWATFGIANGLLGIEVSRKLANASYVLWVSAFNTTFLAAYFAADLRVADTLSGGLSGRGNAEAGKDDKVSFPESMLLGAVSRNQLGVFLFANVLTGLVNLSFDTLSFSIPASAVVVAVYMAVVSVGAVILDKKGLRVRFWTKDAKPDPDAS